MLDIHKEVKIREKYVKKGEAVTNIIKNFEKKIC
jgi:hypothetical protein